MRGLVQTVSWRRGLSLGRMLWSIGPRYRFARDQGMSCGLNSHSSAARSCSGSLGAHCVRNRWVDVGLIGVSTSAPTLDYRSIRPPIHPRLSDLGESIIPGRGTSDLDRRTEAIPSGVRLENRAEAEATQRGNCNAQAVEPTAIDEAFTRPRGRDQALEGHAGRRTQ